VRQIELLGRETGSSQRRDDADRDERLCVWTNPVRARAIFNPIPGNAQLDRADHRDAVRREGFLNL